MTASHQSGRPVRRACTATAICVSSTSRPAMSMADTFRYRTSETQRARLLPGCRPLPFYVVRCGPISRRCALSAERDGNVFVHRDPHGAFGIDVVARQDRAVGGAPAVGGEQLQRVAGIAVDLQNIVQAGDSADIP